MAKNGSQKTPRQSVKIIEAIKLDTNILMTNSDGKVQVEFGYTYCFSRSSTMRLMPSSESLCSPTPSVSAFG